MDKEQEEILRKHKEKYKDESSMDRTSRWVLGTIKWIVGEDQLAA